MSYIIARPWGDSCGIGHQFYNWVVAWQLAHKYGIEFVHSPFCGNQTQPQIDVPVQEWENFLGFGYGELREHDLPKNIEKIQLPNLLWDEASWYGTTIDREEFQDIILNHNNENVLFECAKNQFVVSDVNYMRIWNLRYKYDMARKTWPTIKTHLVSDHVNIAVHIRRGDVTAKGRYKVRWLSDNFYINIMCELQRIFGECVVFHVYTDGTKEDIRSICDLRIFEQIKIYPWGSDIFETFHNMARANILIFGKSQFSVLASLINPNIKIGYKWSPHCELPNAEFVEADLNGSFDLDKFGGLIRHGTNYS
jgi:hypothetical protein